MPKNILMPALSPTMKEGNIVKWLKLEGEQVKDGEVIAEIETDKATMEVEATDDGILYKILTPEGTESVAVNSPIAILAFEGEDVKAENLTPETPPSNNVKVEKQENQNTITEENNNNKNEVLKPSTNDKKVFITPLAKRIAQQNNVNLDLVNGNGPYGRIIKRDIEDFLSKKPCCNSDNHEVKTYDVKTLDIKRDDSWMPEYSLVKVSGMRKTIAKRLIECKQNAPHFYLSIDCEVDELLNVRKRINEAEGIKLTINDFIIKAVSKSLMNVPKANAAWYDDGIHQFKTADVSVAVAIEGGLITPVIRSAELKGLYEISSEMKSLAQKAKDGKLMPSEFAGGTFTISNLGMFGISNFSAIINPPQGCILAVGSSVKKPVVKDDAVVIKTIMTCTLSVDHRVVDGAIGAAFLAEFKKNIENISRMLL